MIMFIYQILNTINNMRYICKSEKNHLMIDIEVENGGLEVTTNISDGRQKNMGKKNLEYQYWRIILQIQNCYQNESYIG